MGHSTEADAPQAADEGDWLDLLVASERIDNWLATISTGPAAQKKQAVLQLAEEVSKREAYAEEAKSAGAINILTKLLSKSDDDEVVSASAKIIAACSGPLAAANKVHEVTFGAHSVWIREGALSDGLGSRIWTSAHILCRRLVSDPSMVEGREVLELGSGCGLVGVLAAKLGASKVTLTDYDSAVLSNLWACVAGNSPSEQSLPVSDSSAAAANTDWEAGNMRIRFLDWAEALEPEQAASIQPYDSLIARGRTEHEPPALEPENRFQVILGSDLLYESYQADMIAAVAAERLDPAGKAYFTLAIRRQAHLDRLRAESERRGLAIDVQPAAVAPGDGGILGREHEYEGGFVTVQLSLE